MGQNWNYFSLVNAPLHGYLSIFYFRTDNYFLFCSKPFVTCVGVLSNVIHNKQMKFSKSVLIEPFGCCECFIARGQHEKKNWFLFGQSQTSHLEKESRRPWQPLGWVWKENEGCSMVEWKQNGKKEHGHTSFKSFYFSQKLPRHVQFIKLISIVNNVERDCHFEMTTLPVEFFLPSSFFNLHLLSSRRLRRLPSLVCPISWTSPVSPFYASCKQLQPGPNEDK